MGSVTMADDLYERRDVALADRVHADAPLTLSVALHGGPESPIASLTIEKPWLRFHVAMTAAELGEVRDAINGVLAVVEDR